MNQCPIDDLQPITALRSTLQELCLSRCGVPGRARPLAGILAALSALRVLHLRGDVGMTSLEFLHPLTYLEVLHVNVDAEMGVLDPLSSLCCLRQLEVYTEGSIRSLDPLSCLSSLQHLVVERVDHAISLVPLRLLPSLRSLGIWFANNVSAGDIIRLGVLLFPSVFGLVGHAIRLASLYDGQARLSRWETPCGVHRCPWCDPRYCDGT
jgi:hypothetical protein